MRVRGGVVLGLAVAVAGCSSPPPGPRSAHREDICEAVFRHELEGHLGVAEVEVYFLTIEGQDPSADFLARFADLPRPVRPGSWATRRGMSEAMSRRRVAWRGMIDKETGMQGRILHIDSLEWASDDEVLIEGGYYENPLSAAGTTYEVEWKGGRWIVTGECCHWIS